MTMDIYKKKYKEANDKVAARFGTNVAKEIFTDLYESEDERIRKAILELVRQSSEILGMQNQSNMIAWLEKQNSNVDNSNKEYWRGYREGKQEILDKYAELEKQGEKKYAWGEDDEKIKKRIILCLEECVHNDIIHDYEKEKCLAWLERQVTPQMVEDAFLKGCNDTKKCLLKRQSEQKPAWSEEDERSKNAAIRACKYMVDNFENSTKQYDDAITWLESLKPQSKQEWSEQDDKMCQETIDWFEKKCFPYALENDNPARESINWLKSIKQKIKGE